MAMTILHNLSAQLTLGELNKNTNQAGKLLSRVSSGQKITGAKDDASAYAISEKMRVRLRSLSQDSQNVQNGSSMLRIAEGGISNIVDELRSLKELAINAATDTNTDEDRHILQKTFEQKMANINDIATTTNYNGKHLLDGTYNRPYTVTSTIHRTITVPESKDSPENYTSIFKSVPKPIGDVVEITADDEGYIINSDGVYTISEDYSGTITINAKNVRITQTDPSMSLSNVRILGPTTGNVNLWIENLNIVNEYGSIIQFSGDNNVLTVSGENTLENVSDQMSAVINVGTGNRLNVQGDGDGASMLTINIPNEGKGAGIGSNGSETLNGDIQIANLNADINAYDGAGIGSGAIGGSIGNVTIENSNLTFTGYWNAEIGAGYNKSSVGDIKVVSSNIVNTQNIDTCIGSGYLQSVCGDITILNSRVESHSSYSPAIGAGDDGSVCNNIYISNSNINTESTYGAGVGTGSREDAIYTSSANSIVIKNNSTIAHISMDGAVVGTGYNGRVASISVSTSSRIDASNAYKSANQVPPNSGIGPGRNGSVGSIGGIERITDNDTVVEDDTVSKLYLSPLVIHSGTKSNQTINVFINDMHTKSLKGQIPNEADAEHLNTLSNDEDKFNAYQAILDKAKDMTLDDASLATRADANVAIRVIEGAIDYALDEATTLGAYLNRLEHTASNITIMGENVQAAESAIRDADMAKEMTNYTKANVLTQAAQSMLAQANQNSSAVLSLIQ